MSRKAEDLLKENELENELIEAMNDLIKAHSKIEDIFHKTEHSSRIDEFVYGEMTDFYPYHKSFDEISSEVETWKKAFTLLLAGYEVEEIKENLF